MTLSGGSATVGSNGLLPGAYTVVASYSGDSYNYGGSASTTLTVEDSPAPSGNIYSYSASSYDTSGNLLAYTDSVMGAWTFTYDQLNRLSTGGSSAGPYANQYGCWTYDSFGNRLTEAVSTTPCDSSPTPTNWAYYDAQNQVTQTNASGTTFYPGYDNAGDVTTDGTNAYLYDAEGRLCAVYIDVTEGGVAYLYDASGNRVAKGTINVWSCDITINGFQQTEAYVVGPDGQQLTEVDGSNNWVHTNVYAGGKQIGTYDGNVSSPTMHYYFDDPLGTRRAQANSSGTLEATYQSLPFGDGYVANTSDDPTENHYTGKEHDTESGNDYFLARYFGSSMGRFISPDPSGLAYAEAGNPQSLNMYSYVMNNPFTLVDPTGLHFECNTVSTQSSDKNGNPIGNKSTGSRSCNWVGDGDTFDGLLVMERENALTAYLGEKGQNGSQSTQSSSGAHVAVAKTAPNNPGLFTCAAGFANNYSIAGGLNALGIGNNGGAGGFLTNALGGNAFSGLTNAITKGVSVADLAFSGTYMGFGGTTAVQKGIAGVATDAAVGGAWSSVTGAGQTIQTINGASSLATTGVSATEFAAGAGIVKVGYDLVSYSVGLAHCY